MKTQAMLVLSCLLLLSCAAKQPARIQPEAQQLNTRDQIRVAKTVQAQDKIRIEATQPADIVNVLSLTNNIEVSMAYVSAENFTGSQVPGYQSNSCYLHQQAALALAQVAIQAKRLGYQLQVLDCYRPQRASNYFMRWVADASDQKTKAAYYPRLNKADLNQGYIAVHSGHSRASTVDLTLLRKNAAGQWQPIDMGGAYDLFDPISHLNSSAISTTQKANRLLLKDLMQQQGFVPYELEWWHFTLENEAYPHSYFDFVVN